MADGKVTIDTSLDNSGFVKDVNSLERAAKSAGKSIQKAMGQSTSKAAETARQKLHETQIEIDHVKQRMQEIEGAAGYAGEATSRAFESAKEKVTATEIAIDDLATKIDEMRNAKTVELADFYPNKGADLSSAVDKSLESDAEYNKLLAQSDRLILKLKQQDKAVEAAKQAAIESSGVNSSEYAKLESRLDALQVKAAQCQSRIGAAAALSDAAARARKAVGNIGDSATSSKLDGIASKIDKVKSRITALFMSAILYNGLRRALTALVNNVKTLIANNTQLSASLNSIKVSLSSAFSSIWSACLPVLQALFSAIARVVAIISSLISGLFGKTAAAANANAKALNKQAGATGAAGGAAEKAEKQLAAFDEVNKLQDNNSGGGGGGGLDYDSAKTPEVPELIEKLNKLLEPLKEISFDNLIAAFDHLKTAVAPLKKKLFSGLEWLWYNILVPLAKWTIEDYLPAFLDALSGTLTMINSVLEALRPLGQWLWDSFLQPLGEWTGQAIVDTLTFLAEKLNALSDWILDHQMEVKLFTIVVGSFAAAWELVNLAMGVWKVIGVLATTVTTALGKAVAFLTSTTGIVTVAIGALIAIIVLLVKNWDKVKEVAARAWEGIKTVWGVVATWFDTYVWAPAMSGLKAFANFFIRIWNGIIAALETCINWIISGLNSVFSFIGNLVNGAVGLLAKVGIDVSWNIPSISPVSIGRVPYLAQGAVLPANKPFLAMVGDQQNGTNVEAPLDTIKQALIEALLESGMLSRGQDGDLVLEIDGQEFARIIKPFADRENRRAGVTLITQGG